MSRPTHEFAFVGLGCIIQNLMKLLSAEALSSANTRPVMGPVSFTEELPEGGRGKRMYVVNCNVLEVPVETTGKPPRQSKTICGDQFGHLTTDHQRRGITGGEVSDLAAAWLKR